MKHYAYESPFKMKDKEGVEYTLKVEQDYNPESPREWSNICTMVCWHRNYDLGDKHSFSDPLDFTMDLYREVMSESWFNKHESDDWSDILQALQESNLILIKAIHLYDHSGLTVSTSDAYPYNDRWDSGIQDFRDYTEEEISATDEDVIFEEWFTDGGYYEVPECMCPICQFIEYSEYDLSAYLLKEYGVPRDEVFAKVKQLNKRRKKLYENEYITYVCKKFDLNPTEIVAGWKEKFGTYKNFRDSLRG